MENITNKVLGNILGPHPKKDVYVKNAKEKGANYVEPYETKHWDKKLKKWITVRHSDVDEEEGAPDGN